MEIRFIVLEKAYATISREMTMGTLMWSDWWRGHEERGAVWTGGVRRVQSKCWRDTGERLDPIVVYRCGGTDKQKDLYKCHTPKTIVRSWSGSGSRWGSKSPRTVRVEIYFQKTWIESTLGEDGGNVGGI